MIILVCEIVACHRFDEEIKSFIIDSNNEMAVSLTKCGNMVLYSLIESKSMRRSGKLEISYKKDQVCESKIRHIFDEQTGMYYFDILYL